MIIEKMQNSLENLTKVTLLDPESQQSYSIYVNDDDAVRCEVDPSFAQSMLFQVQCTAKPIKSGEASSNNIAILNNKSQSCEQSTMPDATSVLYNSNYDETQKRKRFRFSDTDRIKCIRELHCILAEDDFQTEEDVWSRLHDTVMYDNPDRFSACSLRLLKDHMLEQVAKFCTYDSEEATESGKERLQTPWGDYMRQLMTVWDNYKNIAEPTKKLGRPRKAAVSQKKEDVELAKKIRDAAMQTIERPLLTEEEVNDVEVCNNSSFSADHSGSSTPTSSRCITNRATKKRNSNAKEGIPNVFVYLAEKARLENELKKEELKLKQQQHADQVRLQEEALQFKKAKLEYEKERWQREAQQKAADMERNNLLINLLQSVINKS